MMGESCSCSTFVAAKWVVTEPAGGGVVLLVDAGGRRRRAGARRLQGGTDAPAGEDGDGGLNGDVFGGLVGGIEEELLPLEDGHVVGDALDSDAVEMRVDAGDAFGDDEVELVEVNVVATPLQSFAVGGEDDAGDVVDGGRWGGGCRGSTRGW